MKIIKKLVITVEELAVKKAERGLNKSTFISMYELKIPESLMLKPRKGDEHNDTEL